MYTAGGGTQHLKALSDVAPCAARGEGGLHGGREQGLSPLRLPLHECPGRLAALIDLSHYFALLPHSS